MVLRNDMEVFVLARQNSTESISLDAFNGRRVGAALVDGDLLRHSVPVYVAREKTPDR